MTTSPDNYCPKGRIDGLVTTEHGQDVMVYDTASHHIHHLNAFVASVWRACDGRTGIDGIVAMTDAVGGAIVTRETIEVAISQLASAGLLEAGSIASVANPSRRRFMRRAAVAGAIAVPTIVSLSAPNAAAAQSGGTGACGLVCDDANGGQNPCKQKCSQCGKGPGPGNGNLCCSPSAGDGAPVQFLCTTMFP